jgi:hypothetical protein
MEVPLSNIGSSLCSVDKEQFVHHAPSNPASILKGLNHLAQGWPDSQRAYLGGGCRLTPNPDRVAYQSLAISVRFLDASKELFNLP